MFIGSGKSDTEGAAHGNKNKSYSGHPIPKN